MDLQKILREHKKWLETHNEEGARADLSHADLRGADFRGARLEYADFRGARLEYADFRGANLQGIKFRYANLRCADLRDAKGFFLLPVQDPRGYSWTHATLTDKGWKIIAGAGDFSIEEAKSRWGESYAGDREIGDMFLYAIEWLEKKIERESE